MHKYWLTVERAKPALEKFEYVNKLSWHDLKA